MVPSRTKHRHHKCVMLWQPLLLFLTSVICRDMGAGDRRERAMFVQRAMNRARNHEGGVRLLGGRNDFEGNVYIRHANRWGAVCDDSWGEREANVVCGLFNRTGVPTHGSHFGQAASKYWMDDVTCEGEETSLLKCRFAGWGSSDCTPDEAAGVTCHAPARKEGQQHLRRVPRRPAKKNRLRDALKGEPLRLRLVGGRSATEGRVEIYHSGDWGSICGDGWSLYEALVVCRHLGFGHARIASRGGEFSHSPVLASGVQCEGNETKFGLCRVEEVGRVRCPGPKGMVAGVVCTDTLADLVLEHRQLEMTAHLQDVPLYLLRCAMEEMCLTESAYEVQNTNENWQLETRRLLRFTLASSNVGNDDFRPAVPKHLWQWHLCHMHYHSMEVFATFDVLDSSGERVAQGHKASFCLEDNTCMPGVDKEYDCHNYGDQGISVNCTDVYAYNIDCQWVDISDLYPGLFRLKVAVNPHAKVPEQNYHNNAAVCTLEYTQTYARVYDCVLQRP